MSAADPSPDEISPAMSDRIIVGAAAAGGPLTVAAVTTEDKCAQIKEQRGAADKLGYKHPKGIGKPFFAQEEARLRHSD